MTPHHETQHYGTIARHPIALAASVCADSVAISNQVLADTMTLAISTSTTGRCRARPSTRCICCSTSTGEQAALVVRSPSAFNCSAA